MRNLLVLILPIVFIFACSKKSGGGSGGNNSFAPGGKNGAPGGPGTGNPSETGVGKGEICTFVGKNICVEFTGANWNSQEIQNICVYYQGSVVRGACPVSGGVGDCVLNRGYENEAIMKYYPPISRGAAAADCNEANGIFQ
jgi:hypothetical protein